ncbi:MAG TPA: hypothetical protein ENJ09_01600 [Planctomycetes bacterium]|nr:hypothetical protein [Planctomycetota bacterium]
MRLLLLFALLLHPQGIDWEGAWADLARLADPTTDPAEAAELRAGLDALARVALTADPEGPEVTRGALLAVRLAKSEGEENSPALTTLRRRPLDGLTGEELWWVAEVQPPGPARVRALLAALEATAELTPEHLRLAWNYGVVEAQALRLETGALPIQRILEQRAQAPWSTMDLGLTLSRLGRVEELDALFEHAIEREAAAGRDTAELWSRWGIATYGLGRDDLARDRLGRALARGSQDASLVLARMDLRAGRLEAVRSGLRASILSTPPAPWALRCWGISLLPQPRTRPHGPASKGNAKH